MKAVNVDDILKILNKYGEYIFVTDEKKYSDMVDEIANLKALKQESCEDAISRQEVLEEINRIGINAFVTYNDYSGLFDFVDTLPSVTPQPKIGRWIGHREHCENLGVMPSGLGAYEWCSNCDCGIDVREWHRDHYNFCPNCGCCMKSEE